MVETELPDVNEWIKAQDFESTAEIKVPEHLADQVIGQERAVEIVKKAAKQKRHVMLIGDPGTGKSMLAQSMVDFLPRQKMQDILVYPNPDDSNMPLIRTVPAGRGKLIVDKHKKEAAERKAQRAQTMSTMLLLLVGFSIIMFLMFMEPMVLLTGLLIAALLFMATRSYPMMNKEDDDVPKLLVYHEPNEKPPFIDATGSHAGALLGDVRHDPFQSGGLETPAHQRVEAGAIHKANGGVLFVDEINMLRLESQQSLLTALQEKKFPIFGQSERSAGAMVKTEPVPTDFVLVAAGNLDAMEGMHPALRSRIRGYGYEIYMNVAMDDTDENRKKLIRFVAQEVKKDGKIPHFAKDGVAEIIKEAQRRSGRRGKLTLRLRELGGLVRVAGDVAKSTGAKLVRAEHVIKAKESARSLEQQIAERYLEMRKDYSTFVNKGSAVGVVNGLAAIGGESGVSDYSGIVLPIVAEVTPAQTKSGGRIIATGKLGEIAKEAVENVSAIIKKYTGEDISNHDVHIQFIGTYEGVEGDSASISVATAVISALEDVPVDQSTAMTGSLTVRGQVLPVGAVSAKIEAAIAAGLKKVIIPRENMKDVLLDEKYRNMIEIIPADNMNDVLKNALVGSKKDSLLERLSAMVPKPSTEKEPPPKPMPS